MWYTVIAFLLAWVVSVLVVLILAWFFDHHIAKRVVIVQMSPGPLYLVNHTTKTWTTNIWEAQVYTWNRAEFLATVIKGQSMMVVECWQVNRLKMWLHRLVGRPTVNR